MLGRWASGQAPSGEPGSEVNSWNPDSRLAGGDLGLGAESISGVTQRRLSNPSETQGSGGLTVIRGWAGRRRLERTQASELEEVSDLGIQTSRQEAGSGPRFRCPGRRRGLT